MPSIKGFIFDLDGVLVDTAKYHFKAWQRLAGTLGISFTEKDNEHLKGVGREESLRKILAWGKKVPEDLDLEILMKQKNEWYLEMVDAMDENETLPGVHEFLERAQLLHLKLAVGSASKNAAKILSKINLVDYFEAVIDGTQTTRSKPDPQVFQMGAEALALWPQSVVVFEDSTAGIEAALNGGFRTVGIGNKKVLNKAEMVIKGLHASSPAEVINKLNF